MALFLCCKGCLDVSVGFGLPPSLRTTEDIPPHAENSAKLNKAAKITTAALGYIVLLFFIHCLLGYYCSFAGVLSRFIPLIIAEKGIIVNANILRHVDTIQTI
jgi:Na+/H+ antiporter NhaD/arsenite permease-like protein